MPPIFENMKDSYIQAGNYESSSRFWANAAKNLMILQINYHFNSGKQINIKKSSLDNETTAPIKKDGGIF